MHEQVTLEANPVRELNDQFRSCFVGGTVVMTRGVAALGTPRVDRITTLVQNYDSFDTDNDPYGEHDFGVIDLDQTRIYWKIDYYDVSLLAASPNPADPILTKRVLAMMLAEEW